MLSVQETTLELIREVKEIQVRQQKQMADHQKQITVMRREHREQMESMRRFNRGTRKLWVAIAKKVEWLDEDDWPEDEV